MRKTYFFEKNSFFEKMSFFQTNEFFSYFCYANPRFMGIKAIPSPLWSRGYPTRACTISFQVAAGIFKKKTGKFCDFQKNKKCRNSAKNVRKCPKSKSPNPPIKNLFSLQISAHLVFKWLRKSKMITFLGVPITFVISTCKKVDFLDFLGHLKAK